SSGLWRRKINCLAASAMELKIAKGVSKGEGPVMSVATGTANG
ncbi:hypothetical protein E3A20_29710, partial [Planctomyces bekefii]